MYTYNLIGYKGQHFVSQNSINTQQNDSRVVSISDIKEGFVGRQNQVGSINIGNTHDTESLCFEFFFNANNNENIQLLLFMLLEPVVV